MSRLQVMETMIRLQATETLIQPQLMEKLIHLWATQVAVRIRWSAEKLLVTKRTQLLVLNPSVTNGTQL